MLPAHGPNVGWSDSGAVMGTGDGAPTSNGASTPLTIVIRPKVEEQVQYLGLQDPGRKVKKPTRKRVSTSNAKAQVTGEDKAAKVKTRVAAAKTATGPEARPVKEAKAKQVKEAKAKVVKETTAKIVRESKSSKAEIVEEKHVKKEPTQVKIAEVKEPKVKKAVSTTRRRNQRVIAGQPKWSIPATFGKLEQVESGISLDRGPPCNAELRPRVWCTSKEELLSALPELTRCMNGVSWLQSEPPVVFLEEGNPGTILSEVGKDDPQSMELRMTRAFVCAPADLVVSSMATPSPSEFHCNYLISPDFRPVNVKTRFAFDSRPRFIAAPLEPPLSQQQDPPSISNNISYNVAPGKDLEPESEYSVAVPHDTLSSTLDRIPPYLHNQISFPYPRERVVRYFEVPIYFTDSPVDHLSPSSVSRSPLPDTGNPRRCTCDMPRNIYCGVCDVDLEWELDPLYQSKEGDLRYVPAHILMQMAKCHAHAVDDDVTLSSNIFTASRYPPSAPSTASKGDQPLCSCYMYKGMSCMKCLPNAKTNLSQTPAERTTSGQATDRSKLVPPLTIRIPPRAVPLRAAPSQPARALSTLSFKKVRVKEEESAPDPALFATPQPHVPLQMQPNTTEIFGDVAKPTDHCVPSNLPPEVQIIIDAYISGTPLIIVVSQSMLKARWNVSVPAECAYVYLGFFSVGQVLEERIPPSAMLGESEPDRAVGQVEWRFKCIWGASGEEDADATSTRSFPPHPWWNPRSRSPSPGFADLCYPRLNPLDTPRAPRRPRNSEDDPDKSTPRYRTAQRLHPNAEFGLGTEARLGERYWSVLPEHARGQLGTDGGWDQGFGYEAMPSGWWCERCGRVNYQALLRMRWCVGEQCRAEAQKPGRMQGFAVPLDLLRDPMKVMPTIHPYDSYPEAGSVRGSVSVFVGGMRTFSYLVREAIDVRVNAGANVTNGLNPTPEVANPGTTIDTSPSAAVGTSAGIESSMPASKSVVVKHIFAGNVRSLQADSTELLCEIQKNVPLRRAVGDSGPYFSYSVSSDVGPSSAAVVPWDRAPGCIARAKELLVYYARGYGEDRAFELNRLDMFAWVTTGIKKGSSALRCGKRSVMLLCLGSEVVVSVVPKSGFREPEVVPTPGPSGGVGAGPSAQLLGIDMNPSVDMHMDMDGLIPMDVETDANVHGDGMDEDGDVIMDELEAELEADDAQLLLTAAAPVKTEVGDAPLGHVPASSPGKGKGKAKAKTNAPSSAAQKAKLRKQDISVTLLHGDGLMLCGDDFEYSIKRTGTSILLIGSYVEGRDVVPMLGGRAVKPRGIKPA